MKSLGNRHSQHSFAQVPTANMARSKFNRSFGTKDTFFFDELTPVYVEEIIPGDTIDLNVKTFMRLAEQVKPIMDNMHVDFEFFFVPNRIIMDEWEKLFGAQDNPSDSTSYAVPKINSGGTGFAVGSIADHFGIPTGIPNLQVNSLPFRAYNLIWNEWYRDQNLQNSVTVPKSTIDNAANYQILKRAKAHDYYTSALPWPQKGSAVELPLGLQAPVELSTVGTGIRIRESTGAIPANGALSLAGGIGGLSNGVSGNLKIDPNNTLVANLTSATSVTVNTLRQAFMMQSLLEQHARGGTRYVEILKASYNVTSPDFRLQRPEFLSSGRITIQQHPLTQTSESGATPLGTLGAFSTVSETGNRIGFTKSFVEHGYVIGLMTARGEVTYQQGLHKMWTRNGRYDFFWPKLQELGEQSVLRQEIYATGTPVDTQVFGYQERYAEYRYSPSQIKGQFRSTFAETLDVWHLAEEFTSNPTLSAEFIQSNTPIERALVVAENYPHLLSDFWFDLKHARPMVTYGVPATLGRF